MKKISLSFMLFSMFLTHSLLAQNNALMFDGLDYLDIVYCGTQPSLLITGDVTLEAWVCNYDVSTSSAEQDVIISQGIGSTDASSTYNILYSLRLVAIAREGLPTAQYYLEALWEYGGGVNVACLSDYPLDFTPGVWIHLCMTRDATNKQVRFYVNGVQLGTTRPYDYDPNFGTATEFTIGAERRTNGDIIYPFLGKIDEVRVWSVVRSETEIRDNMDQEYTPAAGDNLVLYYKFNETTGTTADNTQGTSALDGTLVTETGGTFTFDNSASPSGAFFGPNGCLLFHDTVISAVTYRPYIDAGFILNPHSAYSGGFTMESWIKPEDITHYNRILAQPDPNSDTETIWLALDQTDGNLYSKFNSNFQSGEYDIPVLLWTHVAVTYNATDDYLRFYVNGALTNAVKMNSTFNDDPHAMYIGWGGYFSDTHFQGKMDEVRIWSDCRSSTEIRDHMCTRLNGNESGLQAYYNFDIVLFDSTSLLTDYKYILDNSGNNEKASLHTIYTNDVKVSTAFNTWLNTASSGWTVDENWSLGTAPASTDNVGIFNVGGTAPAVPATSLALHDLVIATGATLNAHGSDEPTITLTGNLIDDGTFSATSSPVVMSGTAHQAIAGSSTTTLHSLQVSNGTTHLDEGKNLTITNGLTVNESKTFVIDSDADQTGSLLVQGSVTNNGTMQAERYLEGWSDADHGWHFLSSPVTDQAISTEFVDVTANPIASSVDFYRWSEPLHLWVNIKDGSGNYNQGSENTNFSNLDTPLFDESTGYLVAYQTTDTKVFTGSFNNISISDVTLSKTDGTYSGWNLLGNPFPCALDFNAGSWNKSATIGANAQIWDESEASYAVLSGDEKIIPAMNGFMVYTSENGGSLTIPTNARVHSNTSWYKSTFSEEMIVLRAVDPEGNTSQQTLIDFNPEATPDFDLQYDALYLSGFAPLFYSTGAGKAFALNCLPEFSQDLEIPLGFMKNNATHFSIQLQQSLPDITVYLTDHQTGTTQNLTINPVYVFTSEEGDDPNRFLLHFSAVGIDEPATSGNTLPIQVWNHQNTLTISNPEQLTGTFELYNITGKTELTGTIQNVTKQTINHTLTPGIYVIQIHANQKIKNQKIPIQ